jgi:hypothetical protein
MTDVKKEPTENMTKDELADALIDIHGEGDGGNQTEENKQRSTKTKRLIKLALEEAELFHDVDMKAYATIQRDGHRETYPLRSKSFRNWVSGRLWKESQEGCGVQIMQDALGTLEGQAIHEGSCYPVHVRLAERNGTIYLDLGSDRFDVVAIGLDGWRVLENQNIVKFRRPSGMAALPYPKEGGSIDILKKYVNLASLDDWPLLVGFILVCFHPSGPYPNLAFTGEQGSSKSTHSKIIKRVVDPSTAPLRSAPKELRDLAISASNTWILAFDNLSDVPGWLSDGLCRLATGGGFATRTLYSDDEETIFNTKRPVMLNCINNVIRRHDLADRSIVINLAVIPEDKRIPEKELWMNFEDDAPEILGAILDAVSCALKGINNVHLASVPRMADFAMWVCAAEPAFGWEPGTFLNAYAHNRQEVTSMTLDADMVGTVVKSFMEAHNFKTWEGTATELLDDLEMTADDRTRRVKGWPQAANDLSGKLRRSATALRTQGIEVTIGKDPKTKKRFIRLEQVREKLVTIVPDVKKDANDIDIINDISETMFDKQIVSGSSPMEKDRHQFHHSDDYEVDDSVLVEAIVAKGNSKKIVLAGSCNSGDNGDNGDDKIPLSYQVGDLREVIL